MIIRRTLDVSSDILARAMLLLFLASAGTALAQQALETELTGNTLEDAVKEIRAHPQLYYRNGTILWPRPAVIPVCWTAAGFDNEKAIIVAALRSTWERFAEVQFIGFGLCPLFGSQQYIRAYISLGTDQGGGGSSAMGVGALRNPPFPLGPVSEALRPALADRNVSTGIALPQSGARSRIEYLAVHEFGHILGFAHEQDRADNTNRPDPTCNPDGSIGGVYLTRYDPDSIMHYCNSGGNNAGRLSVNDKIGVASQYGTRPHQLLTADFDGDHLADRLVVVPETGRWFISLANGRDPATIGIPFGWQWTGAPLFPGAQSGTMNANSRLALGDYDGDGKTDRAIVDAAGNWYVILSSGRDPATVGIPWGWHWQGMGPNHVLALGDYDGDGKTDRAIVDPAAGNWYVILSSGRDPATVGIPWGWHWGGMGPNHVLALGDYDGDGKIDRAIVDPAAGNWYVILSSGRDPVTIGIPWGWHWGGMGSNHVLALGDYDGDGKTDRAIVDPAAGNWYVILSCGRDPATVGIPWGWHMEGEESYYRLVLGDFDGDGRVDRALVNPQTDQWFLIGSSTPWMQGIPALGFRNPIVWGEAF